MQQIVLNFGPELEHDHPTPKPSDKTCAKLGVALYPWSAVCPRCRTKNVIYNYQSHECMACLLKASLIGKRKARRKR